MAVNKFGVGLKTRIAAHEYSMRNHFEKIIKSLNLLRGGEKEYDAKYQRIINVGNPVNDKDCVNKSYVDTSLQPSHLASKLTTFVPLMLKINSDRRQGPFLVIEPYNDVFYTFHSDTKIAFQFLDFSSHLIEIQIDGHTVGESYLSNKNLFLSVSSGSKSVSSGS